MSSTASAVAGATAAMSSRYYAMGNLGMVEERPMGSNVITLFMLIIGFLASVYYFNEGVNHIRVYFLKQYR